MKTIQRTSALILLLILAGCAHYLVNAPKSNYEADFVGIMGRP